MAQKDLTISCLALFIGGLCLPASALAGQATLPTYTPDLLPSNPETGECYARVKIPARYTSEAERVIVEDGYSTIHVSEPQTRQRQERIMVKEASIRYEVRQPTYKTISKQVMTRPAHERLKVEPAQFKTIEQTLTTSAPRLVWKKGNPGALRAQGYKIHSTADAGRNGRGYRSTVEYGQAQSDNMQCGAMCEIWCLVEEPGEGVSYNRKVMTRPATVRRETVPAQYQTINQQILSDPGGVREIPVPAQYRSISVKEIIAPGRERQVSVPPVYGSVNKKIRVADERYEWRRVVCQPGTRPTITQPYKGASSTGSSLGNSSYSSQAGSYSYGSMAGGGYSSSGLSNYAKTGSTYKDQTIGTNYKPLQSTGSSSYSSSSSSSGSSSSGSSSIVSTQPYYSGGALSHEKRLRWRSRD